MVKKVILSSGLCPGDILTMTAAVESLHRCYPGEYATDVRTSTPDIWQFNPRITPILEGEEDEKIGLNYPSVNRSNQESRPFLSGYLEDLADKLGVPIRQCVNRPQLYLSEEEKRWVNQVQEHISGGRDVRFMILNAGIKGCYPTKAWPVEYYREVVSRTAGVVQWVQVGAAESSHSHPKVDGAIDLIGKTTHRQLIRLVWHSIGGLGPVTYLQHLCAAWEKPYVCLLGGREPTTWVQYPLQHTLHTMGMLECCRSQACWKSKVQVLDPADSSSLCVSPVFGFERVVPKCMAMIEPREVVSVVNKIARMGW